MTPDKDTHYSLLCETSYSEFKPVDGNDDRRRHDPGPDQRRA